MSGTQGADDLIAFIVARLDEDEASARAAVGPDWHMDSTALTVFTRQQVGGDRPGVRGIAWCSNGYGDDDANARHIARHDPARVLREVEAKRAMLIALGAAAGSPPWDSAFGIVLRCTGIAWSDHPDYRAEWAPHARRE